MWRKFKHSLSVGKSFTCPYDMVVLSGLQVESKSSSEQLIGENFLLSISRRYHNEACGYLKLRLNDEKAYSIGKTRVRYFMYCLYVIGLFKFETDASKNDSGSLFW